MASGLLGVWRLQAYVMESLDTGARSEPFGPEPRGTLMLDPDGRMAVLITPGARGAGTAGGAAAPIVAYAGRFRVEPPDRLVTHVDVAWIERWIGTDQARTFALDGDRLDLTTPPGRMVRDGAAPQ